MNIIQHKAFRKVISYAHPYLKVQDRGTLWQLLEKKTVDSRGRVVEEIHWYCPNVSLTADLWTSEDGRKIQAVSYHYLTPDFEMGKVLVGMDQVEKPQQKAEIFLKSLSMCNGVVMSSHWQLFCSLLCIWFFFLTFGRSFPFVCFLLDDTSLREWNLEDNVVSTTTDQGSNVKKCMALFSSISGATWLPCAVHKVQIAINNAWSEGGALPLLDKCRKSRGCSRTRTTLTEPSATSPTTPSYFPHISALTSSKAAYYRTRNSILFMASKSFWKSKRIRKQNESIDHTNNINHVYTGAQTSTRLQCLENRHRQEGLQ